MRIIVETNEETFAATYTGGDYITIHSTPDSEAVDDLIKVWDYEENISVFKMSPRELALTVQDWLRDMKPDSRVKRVIVQTTLLPVDQSDIQDWLPLDE
ncbi:MAG: hypothetical protein RL645_174 [Actinomycetota bacterium]|jgi:sulfite reductase alpha subunit-like flavoprotein